MCCSVCCSVCCSLRCRVCKHMPQHPSCLGHHPECHTFTSISTSKFTFVTFLVQMPPLYIATLIGYKCHPYISTRGNIPIGYIIQLTNGPTPIGPPSFRRYDTGWLRLVGSLKLQVSFAEYSLFHRALLQKRPIISRSPLIVATSHLMIHLVFESGGVYV